MKKRYFLFFLLSVLAARVQAQHDGSIRGRLRDTAARSPVADATVTVLNIKDSSLVSFGRSVSTGAFVVKSLGPGTYRLLVTHVGYGAVSRNFAITDLVKEPDLGEIVLTDASTLLKEVTVTQEAPPVSLRHDTIEFNAGSFKTKPDAVVEDLLKKLPGVQVDKNGNIKANGETVKKVLVDGKEFFGNDPKIASRNLPADAIDKVQVFDKKSDQSQFTGFDDGNSQKTINLTIKKDRKTGMFGRLTAAGGKDAGKANGDFGEPGKAGGGGSGGSGGGGIGGSDAGGDPAGEGRYDTKFSINQFRGNRQLSALGMWNNVNKQGFSFQDALGFNNGSMGQGGGFSMDNSGIPISELMGNGQALTTTKAGGVNFANSHGDRLDFGGNYFYNRADDLVQQKEAKQYLSPDNPFNQDLATKIERYNENHRVNALGDVRIDSFNSLKFTSVFTYQGSSSKSANADSSVSRTSGLLLNEGFARSGSSYKGYSWTNNALWRHRFAAKGRTLAMNLSFGLNDGSGDGSLYSVNNFYSGGALSHADTLNQRYNRSGNGNSYGAVLSYTEPLSKKSLLEFNYNFSQSHSASGKNTFDADQGGKYTRPNGQLTNDFHSTYTYHREGVSFRHQEHAFSWGTGVKWQQAILGNAFGYSGIDSSMRRSFVNILPQANLQYDISKYKNIRAFYNTYTNEPSITQLQPVPDNSDPLNIRAGNPGLRPEYFHALRINYMSFDPFRRTSFMAMLNYDGIRHRIGNDDEVDASGVRTTRPVNLDGLYKLHSYLSWDFPWRDIGSRVNFNGSADYDHNASLVNGTRNNGNTWTIGQGASLEYSHKESIDVTASAKLEYSDARYSLQPGQNIHYWTQTYGLDGSWNFAKGISLESDLSYLSRTGLPQGYNSRPLVWNAGVAAQLFRNKKGSLKFLVFDILRQNTGFTRNTSQNYIDDMSYRVLNRYWLLSFSYSLSRFAGKSVKGGEQQGKADIKVIR